MLDQYGLDMSGFDARVHTFAAAVGGASNQLEHDDFRFTVMRGHSPSKTGVDALMTRASIFFA